MNGLEHLATLDTFMVCLPGRRWEDAQQAVRPFVKSLTYSPGVVGKDVPVEVVREFKGQALSNPDIYSKWTVPSIAKKGDRFWAKSYGCYHGHIRAIETGIATGKPFMVLEDDARFYRTDLALATPAPDTDGVYVWGGAMDKCSHLVHMRKYIAWDGSPNNWNRIVVPEDLGTTCAIEYRSTEAAQQWLEIIKANPHVYDMSWWVAMKEMPVYVTDIEVIQQEPMYGNNVYRKTLRDLFVSTVV